MHYKGKVSLKQRRELSYRELKRFVDYRKFGFQTIEQLPNLTGMVGQERGTKAMQFGLNVNKPGYNIYVSGIPGTGKSSYAKSIVKQFAQKEVKLYDWCYVYNFHDRYTPKMLQLPAGMGKRLKEDMEDFVQRLRVDIPRAFNEETYQKERASIIREFKEKSVEVFEKLNDIAKEYGFIIRQSGSGFVTVPVINGEPLKDEQYENLSKEELKEIEEKTAMLQEKALEINHEVYDLEKDAQRKIESLDSKVALSAVGYPIQELQKRYEACGDVVKYFENVQVDILSHIEDFKEQDEEEEISTLNLLKDEIEDSIVDKYSINLLIDNSQTKGAPMVIADNPTYYNLIGKVEYQNKMGVLTTDYTKIKPGYLHRANGGYIILQTSDILSNHYAWEGLKRALKNKHLKMENIGEQTGLIATSSIIPESIPLDVKVILVGNPHLYQILLEYDDSFQKLFKIKADFDIEMNHTEENIKKLVSFIRTHCDGECLKKFDKRAIAKIIEYSIRLAGHQDKLSTRFNQIVEIMYEADAWASVMENSIITDIHVKKAIDEKKYRSNLYEEKLQESIERGDILIDTQGGRIGQVNGLAVYQLGQYSFGKPSRITATTYVGQKGIVNIERESGMSGSIHNKGVYILSGYLGEKFAQDYPLSLSANIAFEQSYGGVDGDSASSTELYAILSSLAEVPIDQGLAVTGSVNQKGQIQPIGGVNEKVEGFFDVCKSKGLTGKQGVLIPHQNVENLMLRDDVIEAVKRGKFHIYQVKTIEEGIELLTGLPAGSRKEKGEYQENTVYGRVAKKLRRFMEMAVKK